MGVQYYRASMCSVGPFVQRRFLEVGAVAVNYSKDRHFCLRNVRRKNVFGPVDYVRVLEPFFSVVVDSIVQDRLCPTSEQFVHCPSGDYLVLFCVLRVEPMGSLCLHDYRLDNGYRWGSVCRFFGVLRYGWILLRLLVAVILGRLEIHVRFHLRGERVRLLLIGVAGFGRAIFAEDVRVSRNTAIQVQFVVISDAARAVRIAQRGDLYRLLSNFNSTLIVLIPTGSVFGARAFADRFCHAFSPCRFACFNLYVVFEAIGDSVASTRAWPISSIRDFLRVLVRFSRAFNFYRRCFYVPRSGQTRNVIVRYD